MSSHEISFLILSYLLGSIPFGYLVFYFSEGKDIRSQGSGNIGAT
ncbi:MAG: glycerol-3-phosphate acyltransferase, partial [Candidatus Aminicenantes bacterium]|nr:glycerol-3-phosphate acyltransferase [Candidatus Aminicenantes bacterium]